MLLCSGYLSSTVTTVLVITIGICTCTAQTDVTFEPRFGSGGAISPAGSVAENSAVTFQCKYPPAASDVFVFIKIFVNKYEIDDTWEPQISCTVSPNPPTSVKDIHEPGSTVIFEKANTTCTVDQFQTKVVMTATSPKYFKCQYETDVSSSGIVKTVTLRTHTRPSDPKLEEASATIPREGERKVYTCESSARPPPKLRLTYGAHAVPEAEVTHTPPIDSISLDDELNTSLVTWEATATKNMNGEYLYCSVYNHSSNTPIRSHLLMAVYYGPTNKTDQVTWNLREDSEKTVECNFDSNGQMEYQWYNNSIGDSNKLQASQSITLQAKDFSHITESSGDVTQVLICTGKNVANNDQSAVLRLTMTIYTTAVTSTNPSKPTPDTNVDGGTGNLLLYILLPIGVVLLIVVVVAVALVLKKRSASSPAARKKKAAKSGTGGRSNQNGNNSSRTSQPDVIRNSYTAPEVPRSPSSQDYNTPNNRYSQRIEDYASAIDDMPGSRRPVAYSMDDLNDSYDGPSYDGPAHGMEDGGGPPGYDSSMYRDYTPQHNYSGYGDSRYGAAC